MNRSFTYYLGVFRKHWIQILLLFVLTGVGGWFYLKQQEPSFRSAVKLRIIRQQRGPTRDVSFTFEEDQVFYNTQYDLLRTQIDWADMLLDRVAYRILMRLGDGSADEVLRLEPGMASEDIVARLDGADEGDEFKLLELKGWEETAATKAARTRLMPDVKEIRREIVEGRLGLNPDTFLSGIAAKPIPGTHLAELTFRAQDPGVAVVLVNMYAELYRDVSKGEREESIQGEIERQGEKLGALRGRLETARKEKDAKEEQFRNDETYGHLSVAGGENPFQQQADAVAAALNEKQIEEVLRGEQEMRLRQVLKDQGVEIIGFELKKTSGEAEPGDLHRGLAENLAVLALPPVVASENVKSLRARLQLREDERSRLLERFTRESDEVREADGYIREALTELGAEVEATILRYLRTGQDLKDVIAELAGDVKERQEVAKSLNQAWGELADIRDRMAGLEAEIQGLEREKSALTELKSKDVRSGGSAIENIRIERRARIQDTPQVQPNTMLIIVLTGFAAFVLSFGSVLLVEFFDDTIKTKEAFDRYVTVPDLGYIPRISEKEFERRDAAVMEKPRSSVAEAFRSLRTGILFSRRDEEISCFLVSSAGPGEGKTTVVTNLSITMAQAGRGKVLVIDADLRKARLHTALGVENGPGLTNCLVGSATLEEVVRPTPIENLYVMTSGPTPPNPAELLGGHRMKEILEAARKEYGKVIIDTPPLVAVTDTALLAPLVQGVFLVVSMGKTSWRLIERAKQSLAAVGESITGGIVNDVRSTHRGYGYGYGYSYDKYYGRPEDAEE